MALHELPIKKSNLMDTQSTKPSSPSSHADLSARTYEEIPGVTGSAIDVLKQFQTNLSQLEDLHGQMRFMMAEIRSLIIKR